MDERYEGWKNRETWSMALWIENEEDLYTYVKNNVAFLKKEMYTCSEVAEILQKDFQDMQYDDFIKKSAFRMPMWLDVGSFWRIDWYEIVEKYFENSPKFGESKINTKNLFRYISVSQFSKIDKMLGEQK